MEHRFQVDLRGIIEILSEHLYSGPEVFLRELLQNAVDAITAREKLEQTSSQTSSQTFLPQITLELQRDPDGTPLLIFSDNGVGLTEAEVHQFLATIGKSSKREVGGPGSSDFIGQFGIGLLSCFVVSSELHLLSRSAKGGGIVEFKGSPEGNYGVRNVPESELASMFQRPLEVGSRVILRAKPEMKDYFDFQFLLERGRRYGGLLPFPIHLEQADTRVQINAQGAPWRAEYDSLEAKKAALLEFGTSVLGREPFDVIELRSSAGDLDGLALVLPFTPSLAAKPKHVVYLKNMLLSEDAEDLAPQWAFFVRLVVNANGLKPTASREGFAEDLALEGTRLEIGEQLQSYLAQLSEQDPEKFRSLLRLHDLSLRALALENDELFTLFAPQLEFETASGRMSLTEYLERSSLSQHGTLYYAGTLEQFRQMGKVAAAQGINLINGGYIYASELLERYGQKHSKLRVERIEADFFSERFEELTIFERNSSHAFVALAEDTLEPMGCGVELLHFKPDELPALFVTSAQQRFVRTLEIAQEVSSDLFAGVLESIKPQNARPNARVGLIYLNMSNTLIRRLVGLNDPARVKCVLEVLYVQALLLAQHPLSSKELNTLTSGLGQLIELSLQGQEVRRELH
jgi:molecular chaperone HtpG